MWNIKGKIFLKDEELSKYKCVEAHSVCALVSGLLKRWLNWFINILRSIKKDICAY
jgi:hypothetical protein